MCLAQDDDGNLIARYQEARRRAEQSNQFDLLEHFEAYVRANKTVCINMHAQVLRNLLSDPKVRYINRHNNIESGAVVGYDIEQYERRLITDLYLFRRDYKGLVFGALNVGNCGLVSYGRYCVILKKEDIKNRTSFLENNSFNYVVCFSRCKLGINIPGGSRALWCTVSKLCVVKHIEAILAESRPLTPSEISDMVLHSTGRKKEDEFIEAQILKPIGMCNIAKVYYCTARATEISPNSDTLESQPEVEESDGLPKADEDAEIERKLIASLLKKRRIPFEEK